MAEWGRKDQFELRDSEIVLLQKLRKLEAGSDGDFKEQASRLKHTITLHCSVNDRLLDIHPVDADNAVFDCAEVGRELQKKLLSDEWAEEAGASLKDDGAGEEQDLRVESAALQSNKTEVDEEPELAGAWEEVSSDVIPDYVSNVTFSIPAEELTPKRQKELEEQFPGVLIQICPSKECGSHAAMVENPNGVDTAGLELHKGLHSTLPIQTTIEAPRTPRAFRIAQQANDEIESHLLEFAEFMTQYPPIGAFEADYDDSVPWSELSSHRKFDIAHARLIQSGRYGETRDPSKRCTRCQKRGYTCKVYQPRFIEKSRYRGLIVLGGGCQNCRLLGEACEIPPGYERLGSGTTRNCSSFAKPFGATREFSVDRSSEATVTTPEPPRRTPTLATRMTKDDTLSYADIENINDDLRLGMNRVDVIHSIYDSWCVRGKGNNIRRFDPRQHHELKYYYINLVDLYIIAREKQLADLEYATLLQFQVTTIKEESPNIDVCVMKAFRYLPEHSPLCRWMSIFFSSVWDIPRNGDYSHLWGESKSADRFPAALGKFLAGVESARDPYRSEAGSEEAAIERFCEVHEHAVASDKEARCKQMRNRHLAYKSPKWVSGGTVEYHISKKRKMSELVRRDSSSSPKVTLISVIQFSTSPLEEEDAEPVNPVSPESDAIQSLELDAAPHAQLDHAQSLERVSWRYTPSARVQSMHSTWGKTGRIPPSTQHDLPRQISTAFPQPGQGKTDVRYEDLLDLFIYAKERRPSPKFKDALLREWKDVGGTVAAALRRKAARELPAEHDLVQYLDSGPELEAVELGADLSASVNGGANDDSDNDDDDDDDDDDDGNDDPDYNNDSDDEDDDDDNNTLYRDPTPDPERMSRRTASTSMAGATPSAPLTNANLTDSNTPQPSAVYSSKSTDTTTRSSLLRGAQRDNNPNQIPLPHQPHGTNAPAPPPLPDLPLATPV